jgi:hypothetical protein
MREQDLEFNPEYSFSKGGKTDTPIKWKKESAGQYVGVGVVDGYDIKITASSLENRGWSWDVYVNDSRMYGDGWYGLRLTDIKKGAMNDVKEAIRDYENKDSYAKGGYIAIYENDGETEYSFELADRSFEKTFKSLESARKYAKSKGYKVLDVTEFKSGTAYAKGGKTKKFPVAVKRRIDEINEMLPKVNESGDYASTYAGSTMESYIILDKPIQIKGNYVYISEEDSSWGNYGFEKRYNVNDTKDIYESINGRKGLMLDLGIIKRAFTKLLKSEGKMAKGGKTKIKNMSKYKKGGWIQEATKEMEEDGTEGAFTKQAKRAGMSTLAFAKKVLKNPKKFTETTRKRAVFMKNTNPEKFNVGGEIVRAYDVNRKSGVGTYAEGGEITRSYDVNINSGVGTYARGGKSQGYNAQLDESLGVRKGAKRTKQQSDKDRRDEAKAMNKAMDRRAYSSVRGMDKGRRMMAKGGSTMPRLKKGDKVEIVGKRWFQKSYGNTYHTTKVYVNDRLIGETDDYVYGYGDQYLQTGLDILFKHYLPPYKWSGSQSAWTLKNYGIKYKDYVRDVDRQRDLYSEGGKITMAGDTDFPSELLNYAKGGWHKDRKYISDEKHEKAYAPKRKTAGKKYKKAQGGNIMQDISPNANDGMGDIMPDASSMVDYAKGGELSELHRYTKKRFKNLSNEELVDLINRLYQNGKNDDDQVAELVRRRDEQGFKVVAGYDSYRIEYAKGGKVKFQNGGVVSEWIIETRNESEYFDYEDDARDFWNSLSEKERKSGQFFRKDYGEDGIEVYVEIIEEYAKGGKVTKVEAKKRLEEIRKSLDNENISYGELYELQLLSDYIDKDDVRLREAAGLPEYAKGGVARDRKFASQEKHEIAYAPKRKKPFKRYKGRK